MNERKNIDRLFQEKFKDFEVAPDEAVWEKIKARQNQKKKRALLILPFWYRVAGVAALVAVIFSIGYFSRNTDPVEDIVLEDNITTPETKEAVLPNNTITDSNEKDFIVSSNEEETKKPVSGDHKDKNQTNHINITNVPQIFDDLQEATANTSEEVSESLVNKTPKARNLETTVANNSIKKSGTPITSNPKERDLLLENKQVANNTVANTQNNETKPKQKEAFSEPITRKNNTKQNVIAQNNTDKDHNVNDVKEESKNSKHTLEDQNKKSIFDAINQEEEAIAKEETNNKKWNVSPNVAPVYYNSIGNGSSIDAQFADNDKSGRVNMSYGVQVSYNLNNRLSIRSGISKVDLSYNTQDIGFSATSIASQNLRSINYDSNAEAILISDIGSNQSALVASDINRGAINQTQNEGLLNQKIGYLEVPLEMKYALVNKKLGVNMIGGVSTLFLQDNEVSIEAGDFETSIGEANNLNEVSFTGNVGIGFDYKLSDQFQVNLEPIFKYQFNGFSGNTENFRPYYFGVYTGVSIKF